MSLINSLYFVVSRVVSSFFACCGQELHLPRIGVILQPHDGLVVYELVLVFDTSGKVHLLRNWLIVGAFGHRALPSALMARLLSVSSVTANSLRFGLLLLGNIVLLNGGIAFVHHAVGGNQKRKVHLILGLRHIRICVARMIRLPRIGGPTRWRQLIKILNARERCLVMYGQLRSRRQAQASTSPARHAVVHIWLHLIPECEHFPKSELAL